MVDNPKIDVRLGSDHLPEASQIGVGPASSPETTTPEDGGHLQSSQSLSSSSFLDPDFLSDFCSSEKAVIFPCVLKVVKDSCSNLTIIREEEEEKQEEILHTTEPKNIAQQIDHCRVGKNRKAKPKSGLSNCSLNFRTLPTLASIVRILLRSQ